MDLTKDTTEQELFAPVTKAREALAAAAADSNVPSTTLLNRVHEVFAAEAVGRLNYQVVAALQAGGDVNKVLVGLLVQGADDAWSGRSNDARRYAFDAVRDATRDIHWSLRKQV